MSSNVQRFSSVLELLGYFLDISRRIFLDCFADIFLAEVSGGEFRRIVAASYSNATHGQK